MIHVLLILFPEMDSLNLFQLLLVFAMFASVFTGDGSSFGDPDTDTDWCANNPDACSADLNSASKPRFVNNAIDTKVVVDIAKKALDALGGILNG